MKEFFQTLGRLISDRYHFFIRGLLCPKARRLVVVTTGLAIFGLSLVPRAEVEVSADQPQIGFQLNNQPIGTQPSFFNLPVKTTVLSQKFSLHHRAIDLAAPSGEPIFPIGPGRVSEIETDSWGLGKMVEVKHSSGYLSKYGHLSQILVKKDQEVTITTPLGLIGTSGWTSGPHLHLEVWEGGVALDPLHHLKY